jgi:hypothetical protein
MCVICCEVLANKSFKVNKLIHLRTKRRSLAGHDADLFKRMAEVVKKTRVDSSGLYQQKNYAAIQVCI